MAAQKVQASTQKFTEIIDFIGSIVVMSGGNACVVIELTASNFSLLSRKEQDARIYSYASLLNSLSFPIQILIRNKKMDISSYIKELDRINVGSSNELLVNYVKFYKSFVQEMVTINTVLNKSFYVVIPYSSIELGAKMALQTQQGNKAQIEAFANSARTILDDKANILIGQLRRFSLTAKMLEREDLIKLFYDIYNEGEKIENEIIHKDSNKTIVKGGPK